MGDNPEAYETGLLYLIIEDQRQTDFSFLKELQEHKALSSVLLTQATEATALALLKACHALDLPLLIENDIEMVMKIQADGVHLLNPKAVAYARKTLGSNTIIGASCDQTRHDAMVVGELEPDYIMFGGYATGQDPTPVDQELAAWWLEMMEIPVVTIARTDGEARELDELGADFIGRVNNHS
jgi:thiamine-phosphate pyrophosphorylase